MAFYHLIWCFLYPDLSISFIYIAFRFFTPLRLFLSTKIIPRFFFNAALLIVAIGVFHNFFSNLFGVPLMGRFEMPSYLWARFYGDGMN